MKKPLTERQTSALRAVAGQQKTTQSLLWWEDARRNWHGRRRTLGSLTTRRLVEYSSERGWEITEDGLRTLAEIDQHKKEE